MSDFGFSTYRGEPSIGHIHEDNFKICFIGAQVSTVTVLALLPAVYTKVSKAWFAVRPWPQPHTRPVRIRSSTAHAQVRLPAGTS